VFIEPGQQCQGDPDLGAEIDPGDGRLAADGNASAGAAQQEPVGERPDQSGMLGRLAGQGRVQPGGQSFQVIVAFGQDAGDHQQLADVVLVPAGWEFVELLVAAGLTRLQPVARAV
jgi:hypothetical protein